MHRFSSLRDGWSLLGEAFNLHEAIGVDGSGPMGVELRGMQVVAVIWKLDGCYC